VRHNKKTLHVHVCMFTASGCFIQLQFKLVFTLQQIRISFHFKSSLYSFKTLLQKETAALLAYYSIPAKRLIRRHVSSPALTSLYSLLEFLSTVKIKWLGLKFLLNGKTVIRTKYSNLKMVVWRVATCSDVHSRCV
jgi:hypothetical protein